MELVVFESGGVYYIAMKLNSSNLPRRDGDDISHRVILGKRKNEGYESEVGLIRNSIVAISDFQDLKLSFQLVQKGEKYAGITGNLKKIIEEMRRTEGKRFTEEIDDVEVQLVS